MVTPKTVFQITIPKWKNKVPIGKVAPVYYTKNIGLPQKHAGARLRKIGRKFYYVDKNNKRLIKNVNKVGNIKYWRVNGQKFYSANIHWKTRSTIVNFYHRYFKDKINKKFKAPFPMFAGYSLDMHILIYELYTSDTPDITNMWILAKIFEDVMVAQHIFRDDSPQYRLGTSYKYKFVEDEKDRKLVIKFKYTKA